MSFCSSVSSKSTIRPRLRDVPACSWRAEGFNDATEGRKGFCRPRDAGSVKVFVAGSTGVLGLARSAENERVLASLGAEPRRGDLFDVEALVNAARGAGVVVRAATSIPRGLRMSVRDWALNDRIRRDGTKALTECAGRILARLYLQEGIVWVAQPVDGSAFDEDARVRPRLWFAGAADAESIAREAGDRLGFEVATLRCGSFYCAA